MIRIVDGTAYEGKRDGQFVVKAFQSNGHSEITAARKLVWSELSWDKAYIEDYLAMLEKYRAEHEAERRDLCAKVAAARAKKRVRQSCKTMGADTLLTLTYRGLQSDLSLCKTHLKEFVRRLKRIWPSFQAVAAFELQQRGAWHVHLATVAVPTELNAKNGVSVKSYNVIRAVWRSVTKEFEGNIDIQKKKRNSKRSPAKIASYLAKYITKNYIDGEKWSNRWTTFGNICAPATIELGLINCPLEMINLCYDLCSKQAIVNAHFSKWGDWFFIHAERDRDKCNTAMQG